MMTAQSQLEARRSERGDMEDTREQNVLVA